MTKTLQESLERFAGQARPLRTLTKEQLFIYPQADPSQEAALKFTREVMHRRRKGDLQHEEVQDHYRSRHLAEYEQMVAKWHALDLFRAQQFGWAAFLTCDLETRRADKQIFLAIETLACLCSEDRSKTYLEINALGAYRIAPSGKWRRQFLDEEGNLRTPSALDKEDQRRYWEAWRAYNTATFNYKWPDDSGTAYDERVFKITTNDED